MSQNTAKIYTGFTLAEVLITLGIIGIVAAMTLPTLITKYKDKELITRTKKVYSNIQNAVLLSQKDMGVVGDNTIMFDVNQTSVETAKKFAKYFNGAKVCENSSQDGCSKYYYTVKYATRYSAGGSTTLAANRTDPKIILNDGTIIAVRQNSACIRQEGDCQQDATGSCIKDENGDTTATVVTHNNCASVYIDVNGTQRPNQYGRDNYHIQIMPGTVAPSYWSAEGGSSIKNILSNIDKLEYEVYNVGDEK